MFLGILATRYRDIGPLLFSVVQLLFFMTPIIWNGRDPASAGRGPRSSIVSSTRCCTIWIDAGAHCWALTRSAALAGGAGVDRRRLDAGGVRDAAVSRAGALLGVGTIPAAIADRLLHAACA